MGPINVDLIWISIAFLCGFAVFQVGLPPLIGFIGAGFILKGLGLTSGFMALEAIANIGVMVMLFTIGLKLHIKDLLKPEIWATTTVHTVLSVVFFGSLVFLASVVGLPFFTSLTMMQAALVGFALSFSSTVFAVKVLEESGTMSSRYGQLAIGILVVQDIFAVLFMTFAKGSMPSLWALALPPFLWLMRPLLFFFLDRSGRGELFALLGLFAAFAVGAFSFQFVGLKPDLGALIIGALLADHPKAANLSKTLLNFKDLFLIGFFFSIGLTGIPSWNNLFLALILSLFVIFKSGLFFFLFTRFHLRARTALFSTAGLSNYSEFGLIVAAVGAKNGWINSEWLIILALTMSFSFVAAAPFNSRVNALYDRFAPFLKRFQSTRRLPGEEIPVTDGIHAIVCGMGRIGVQTFTTAVGKFGPEAVLGFDHDKEVVVREIEKGRNVCWGDAADKDFWERVEQACKERQDDRLIEIVILAMPSQAANLTALQELQSISFKGSIAVMAKYDDDVAALEAAGADLVFNLYAAAATGFAEHVFTTPQST
ncbi:MAG: cation:proton antiporter [Pseudomonadota bacterium]|nr:cation:proton antiporter [Pseudomonadota bacterium]